MDYSATHSIVVPHPQYLHLHPQEVLGVGDNRLWRNDIVVDSGGNDSLMPLLVDDTVVLHRSRQESEHQHHHHLPRRNSIVEVRQVVTSQQQVSIGSQDRVESSHRRMEACPDQLTCHQGMAYADQHAGGEQRGDGASYHLEDQVGVVQAVSQTTGFGNLYSLVADSSTLGQSAWGSSRVHA